MLTMEMKGGIIIYMGPCPRDYGSQTLPLYLFFVEHIFTL
jgi:hypothetical protein